MNKAVDVWSRKKFRQETCAQLPAGVGWPVNIAREVARDVVAGKTGCEDQPGSRENAPSRAPVASGARGASPAGAKRPQRARRARSGPEGPAAGPKGPHRASAR